MEKGELGFNPDSNSINNENNSLLEKENMAEPVANKEMPAKHKESELDRQKAIKHIRGVIRTDRSSEKYQRFFGKEIVQPKGKILDLAAGDSNFAETVNKDGDLKVIRCDFGYASDPPKYKEGAVAGLAQELPFGDNEFEKVITSFLFEHIREKDVPKVLSEMLRVTEDGGELMIYPSYRALKKEYPFAQRKVLDYETKAYRFLQERFASTLVVEKNSSLTPEEWEKAIKDITRSVKMPRSMEKIERLWMKVRILLTGHNKLHR